MASEHIVESHFKSAAVKFIVNRALASVDIAHFVTNKQASTFSTLNNRMVIENPISDVKANFGSIARKANKKFVSVGRLTYQKNYIGGLDVVKSMLTKPALWKYLVLVIVVR